MGKFNEISENGDTKVATNDNHNTNRFKSDRYDNRNKNYGGNNYGGRGGGSGNRWQNRDWRNKQEDNKSKSEPVKNDKEATKSDENKEDAVPVTSEAEIVEENDRSDEIPPPEKKKFTGRCRLFVGNLPYDITEEIFRRLFEPYGEINEVFVNPQRAFGFVRLETRHAAEAAKAGLDGMVKKGRTLRVRFATHGAAIKVKELDPYVTNELLEEAFCAFGALERSVVIVDDRGKPTGEGIVEFARKPAAAQALQKINEGVFLLGATPQPIVAEPLEQKDDEDGLPEKFINKNQAYNKEREHQPRMAVPGSFEFDFGNRWKQQYLHEEKQRANLERQIEEQRAKIEMEMGQAQIEHQAVLLRQDYLRKQEELKRLEEQHQMDVQRKMEQRRRIEMEREEEERRLDEQIRREQERFTGRSEEMWGRRMPHDNSHPPGNWYGGQNDSRGMQQMHDNSYQDGRPAQNAEQHPNGPPGPPGHMRQSRFDQPPPNMGPRFGGYNASENRNPPPQPEVEGTTQTFAESPEKVPENPTEEAPVEAKRARRF